MYFRNLINIKKNNVAANALNRIAVMTTSPEVLNNT